MTTRPNIYILLGTVFIILTLLFVGLFRDDEFYEPTLFTKYRPTFKVNFYSPIGMQDLKLDDLPTDRKAEEIAFQEFVMKRHIQNNSDARLWYLPFILIQMILTFLTFGILKMKRELIYKKWQLPTHFAVCLLLTSLGLGIILSIDNLLAAVFGGLLILTINYWTVVLLTRQKNEKSYT